MAITDKVNELTLFYTAPKSTELISRINDKIKLHEQSPMFTWFTPESYLVFLY